MKPYTAYALVQTTPRTGSKELALFDARLPLYWRRHVANAVNAERCNGEAEVVQVTIRKRAATKVRHAKRAVATVGAQRKK